LRCKTKEPRYRRLKGNKLEILRNTVVVWGVDGAWETFTFRKVNRVL